MPTYELVLLLKKLPVPELKSALRKTALSILEMGAVLRKIENLGFKKLPYRMTGNSGVCSEANFFVYTFDGAVDQFPKLKDSLKRDRDVVRQRIYFVENMLSLRQNKPDCDIYLDMLEVPDRPHVQLMVKLSKKRENKKAFVYGGGRDYDPLAK